MKYSRINLASLPVIIGWHKKVDATKWIRAEEETEKQDKTTYSILQN